MEQVSGDESSEFEQEKIILCQQARHYDGALPGFWTFFLKSCTGLVDADFGLVTIWHNDSNKWNTVCLYPDESKAFIRSSGIASSFNDLSSSANDKGYALAQVETEQPGGLICLIAVRLDLPEHESASVAIFGMKNTDSSRLAEIVIRLQLMADAPLNYLNKMGLKQAKTDVVRFLEAMDVAVQMNIHKRYIGASMTLCNEVAARFGCDRVSFGWVIDGYVCIQAISHIEKFEKKMAVVQSLEAVMEEAVSQDEEVLLPRHQDSTSITRDHESFAKDNGVDCLASFPIRLDNDLVGALTCERSAAPKFTETEVQAISLIANQSARRLSELRENDRWFGARIASDIRQGLAGLLGVEHTLAKLAGFMVFALLLILVFGKMEFRVEAPFVIKSDDIAYLPASFDGYIDEVYVDIGDLVDKDNLLLSLDTRELLLEESNARANKIRYEREAQKARSTNSRSEMKIAEALTIQAEAQLKLIKYHLDNAQIKAPFAGIVVEGDLEEMLGAPVRKGDVLYKLAKLKNIYAELAVDEKDIHHIVRGASGEIAFVSQPKFKYPIDVTRIDPVAVTRDEGNKFVVRSEFVENSETWWRPGMSGIAKINAGKKNIGWIITRRTVDFLRLFLWW